MTERSRSGKTAWDKEKTRELFRRYKETGDPDAREQLVMSHMNLVRFLANKFKNRGEARVHHVCYTYYSGRD